MATNNPNNSFSVTLGSRLTPTMQGTRVAIVQDGAVVGYGETRTQAERSCGSIYYAAADLQ